MSKSIGIVGMGWLGTHVANHFKRLGDTPIVSTTKQTKADVLKHDGYNALVYDLNDLQAPTNLRDASIHFIAVPPTTLGATYTQRIENYCQQLHNNALVFFVSSTSVYPNVSGNFSENSPVPPSILNEAEQKVATVCKHHFILRCGGLIGANRHPGNFLAGKKHVQNPNACVNLIHGADVALIAEKLLTTQAYGTYNACVTSPLSKQTFYTNAALLLGLNPPEFEETINNVNRIVDASKLTSIIGQTFTNTLNFYAQIERLN